MVGNITKRTVDALAQTFGGDDYVENVTVGTFIQQQFGWRDRLFLTGAVRAEGGVCDIQTDLELNLLQGQNAHGQTQINGIVTLGSEVGVIGEVKDSEWLERRR